MTSTVTKLKIDEPDRREAKKGANFLEQAASLDHAGLFLIRSSGEKAAVELPPQVLEALRAVLDRIAKHEEVLLYSADAELTPEQAARILGISRPLVYQRMNSGRLPYREVGTHRRVLLDDVVKLRAFEDRRRRFSEALAADTDELESDDAQSRESSS